MHEMSREQAAAGIAKYRSANQTRATVQIDKTQPKQNVAPV
jgi:hypothetical protein